MSDASDADERAVALDPLSEWLALVGPPDLAAGVAGCLIAHRDAAFARYADPGAPLAAVCKALDVAAVALLRGGRMQDVGELAASWFDRLERHGMAVEALYLQLRAARAAFESGLVGEASDLLPGDDELQATIDGADRQPVSVLNPPMLGRLVADLAREMPT